MYGRLVCLVLLASLALRAAPRAQEQEQDAFDRFLGRTVTGIRLELEDRPVVSDDLMAQIDVEVGEPLTIESLRRSEQRLANDPRFEDVIVLAADTPAGVEVVFRLVPRHPVDDIEFTGDTGLSPAELERQVRDQYGGVPTGTRIRDVEEIVKRILSDEGFRRAAVNARIVETHNPDRATLVFTVTAGQRTIIRSVGVKGTSSLTPEVIQKRTGVQPGLPFRERAIATELSRIRDDLRERGYYAAIASYAAVDDSPEIDLVLQVEDGPLVELRIEPDSHMPRGRRDDYIPIQREGSIDRDLLDDSRDAIRAALRREGYWKAEVGHIEERPSQDRQVITFKISRGKRYRIAALELGANSRLTGAMLEKAQGLEVGEWFSETRVRTEIALLVEFNYIQQGFHRAQFDPQFVEIEGRRPDEGGVIIRPTITEGPRATVTDIVFDLGDKRLVTEADVRSIMLVTRGAPYVYANVQRDAEAIAEYYGRRGFQPTEFGVDARLSEQLTETTILVRVREGLQLIIGDITVVGNDRISRETILEEITLRPGQAYSNERRLESQLRLSAFGFQSIRIIPEPRLPGENTVRITISVQEVAATSIGGGGGLEVGNQARDLPGGGREDRLEFSPRAFFEIGRRNLGGRNRDISFYSRVALKPSRTIGEGFGFNEYRVSGTYRERYAFRTQTDLLIGITSEQAVRPSFSFIRQVANADLLRFLTPRVTVSGRYGLEFTRLFDRTDDPGSEFPIDRFIPQLRLSILSGGVLWNRRDDTIAPTRGFDIGINGDLALEAIGSEVGFAKTFLQGAYFRSLAANRRLVLATRAQLGIARGFERLATTRGPDGRDVTETLKDVPANHRFYAGGGTTVRGFQLDRLGVPEILTVDGVSNGGNGEVILNAELRSIVGKLFNRNLAVVGFIDSGQVFRLARDIDLARLRGTPGIGLRYDSPFGPVRLDFGFKMDRIVYGNGRRERGWEYHLSIGEAF